MSESDEFTIDITRQEAGDIVVTILGADVVGLMDDGQRLPLHSARCTMLDDDELNRLRDGIDRLLSDVPETADAPDAGEIMRQVMSGAIGAVCDIDGAVHVHLPMGANALERATSGVLIEVAQERTRQRVKLSNDRDDERTEHQAALTEESKHDVLSHTWDGLHYRCWGQVWGAPNMESRREQLVKACVVYAAEIEAIDRRNES